MSRLFRVGNAGNQNMITDTRPLLIELLDARPAITDRIIDDAELSRRAAEEDEGDALAGDRFE
jgi:hypothetical protein